MRGMEENQIAPRTALSTPTLILRQVQARITANHNELDELMLLRQPFAITQEQLALKWRSVGITPHVSKLPKL